MSLPGILLKETVTLFCSLSLKTGARPLLASCLRKGRRVTGLRMEMGQWCARRGVSAYVRPGLWLHCVPS